MNPLLIIKTGTTLPELLEQKGDFEDWIIAGLDGAGPYPVCRVVNVQNGDELPEIKNISGAIITGSHDMVTEQPDWSRRTAVWLNAAVKDGLPVLGICYGHQLLAYTLGGDVGYNPHGREYGSNLIHLSGDAVADPLFVNLKNPFYAHTSHAQTIRRLPPGALCLAYSQREANQAFRYGTRAWGVQFHPEFDSQIMRTYIRHNRAILIEEGQDPNKLLDKVRVSSAGNQIFHNFLKILMVES